MTGEADWGFLLLDKPEGITSHTAVNRAARALGFKKAGHAGTLDPLASGLMLVGLGRATRLLEYLVGCDKSYLAVVRLGVETDTLDREGQVVAEDPNTNPPDELLLSALASFTGEITQVPPSFSAIKVGGVPLYKKARKGEEVEVPERKVTISELKLLEREGADLTLEVGCSSGTYIRSLARDLALALGTRGSLWGLRRTRCGPFLVENAVSLGTLQGLSPEEGRALLNNPMDMLFSVPRALVGEKEAADLLHGKTVPAGSPVQDGAEVRVSGPDGNLLALCTVNGELLIPRKVFN